MHGCFTCISLGAGVGQGLRTTQSKENRIPFRKGLGVRRGHEKGLAEREEHPTEGTAQKVTLIQMFQEFGVPRFPNCQPTMQTESHDGQMDRPMSWCFPHQI